MSLAGKARATPERRGGMKHTLPKILAVMSPEDRADLLDLLADPLVQAMVVKRTVEDAYPDAHRTHQSAWFRWCTQSRDDPRWLDQFRG